MYSWIHSVRIRLSRALGSTHYFIGTGPETAWVLTHSIYVYANVLVRNLNPTSPGWLRVVIQNVLKPRRLRNLEGETE